MTTPVISYAEACNRDPLWQPYNENAKSAQPSQPNIIKPYTQGCCLGCALGVVAGWIVAFSSRKANMVAKCHSRLSQK